MNLLQTLKAKLLPYRVAHGGNHFSYKNTFIDFILPDLKLPQTTTVADYYSPSTREKLGFNRFTFVKVTNDEIVFSAKGVDQNPKTLVLALKDGEIIVSDEFNGYLEPVRIPNFDVIIAETELP